jgi:hypothetical protein
VGDTAVRRRLRRPRGSLSGGVKPWLAGGGFLVGDGHLKEPSRHAIRMDVLSGLHAAASSQLGDSWEAVSASSSCLRPQRFWNSNVPQTARDPSHQKTGAISPHLSIITFSLLSSSIKVVQSECLFIDNLTAGTYLLTYQVSRSYGILLLTNFELALRGSQLPTSILESNIVGYRGVTWQRTLRGAER